jgi:arsenate reductase
VSFPELDSYVKSRVAELDGIPEERGRRLKDLASHVGERIDKGETARLTFVCTHNSRRSQMAQLWAATAAAHHGISGVEVFSGGTEATALNPRVVVALRRAGFEIRKTSEGANPVYAIRYSDRAPELKAFSKLYGGAPNPIEGFCAVMTCDAADAGCPVVHGAEHRVSLPYEDPKDHDGTEEEAEAYDERCRQIAREMLYLFSQVQT